MHMMRVHYIPVSAAALLLTSLLSTVSFATSNVVDLCGDHWTLQNLPLNISVPASLPSQAHLDLYENQVIGNPLYGLNDFSLRWVAWNNWTYVAPISGLRNDINQTYLLFQGLDTFCTIELCGQHVASTNNQFRQYHFDVSKILTECHGEPVLSLNFGSAPTIVNGIAAQPGQEQWPYGVEIPFEFPNRQFMRKEQNDFGWDWGPAFAPAGPWLPAYAVQLGSGDIHPRNTLIDAYRLGQRNNLIPDQAQPWVVNASIDYIGSLPKGASLTYRLQDTKGNKTLLSGNFGDVNVTGNAISGSVSIPDDAVQLWWPAGMGPQNLYNMTINITGADNKTLASVEKRIGFRTIVLNEMPVTDDEIALGVAPGNHWHFEINGQPFFAKGSNFIPPDTFWPRVTEQRIRALFDAVVSGRQNMLRVWSSGAYSPDFMFDIADEMGILLWSEFEFGDALYPVNQDFLDNAYEEAVYQVRRVNHHPSLAYWAGGNELENLELPTANGTAPDDFPRLLAEYEKLFLTTLFPAVFENSRSISYAPSSTSNGFISLNFTEAPYMQERYKNLTEGHIYGETDYYNYNSRVSFDTSEYPVGRFSNEFGFHSMPSLQTWRQALPNNQLTFNSSFVVARNRHYPPSTLNITDTTNSTKGMAEMTLAAELWYPVPNKTDSVANFSSWCWTTQVFQADYYASQINFYRRGSGLPQRTLGSLYWQLEDIWQAPSWAGIEYDGVHGAGRWKVLHYRAKDAYAPITGAPFYNASTGQLEIYVTSDLWKEASGTASLQWYSYNGTELTAPKALQDAHFTIGALNTTRVYTANAAAELANATIDPADAVARISVTATGTLPNGDASSTLNHTSWFHAAPLSSANLVDPGLTVTYDNAAKQFTVEATKGVSAWTWLDYPAGAVVAFEDNGFWLAKGEKRVLGYEVKADTTYGTWVEGVIVQSLWDNTQS